MCCKKAKRTAVIYLKQNKEKRNKINMNSSILWRKSNKFQLSSSSDQFTSKQHTNHHQIKQRNEGSSIINLNQFNIGPPVANDISIDSLKLTTTERSENSSKLIIGPMSIEELKKIHKVYIYMFYLFFMFV